MKKGVIFLLTFFITVYLSPFFISAYANSNTVSPTTKITTEHGKINHSTEKKLTEHKKGEVSEHEGHYHLKLSQLTLWWVIPFVGILLSIAIFPLVAPHFWHHHYGKVSLFWGLSFFIAFTVFFGGNVSFFYLLEVYLLEFISFITLLLALFTVSGGIMLKGDLAGSPKVNAIIILIGTVLASWIGTTGAAMLLVRPLIRANGWRKYKTHIIVFFIFLVANIGGSLTPIGDPPLFLGFLHGVNFFWTLKHILPILLFTSSILLVVFFIMDSYYYKKEPGRPPEATGEKLALEGKMNLLLFPAIIAAVLISSLNLGTAFTIHTVKMPLALLIQITLFIVITFISLKITKKEIRKANEFGWEPIVEVAKLFATIFITMVPAIQMLRGASTVLQEKGYAALASGQGGPLGPVIKLVVNKSGEFINSAFFWATGILSSFLDNAPTYVVFFNTAGGDAKTLMTTHAATLLAVSVGAVFMGANTYIGNAPNFMVKSIAEESGVPMPSFFGYIFKYSIPILIPTFLAVMFIFF